MSANNKPSDSHSLVLPWKTRISVSALSAVTDFFRRSDGTVNRHILSLLDVKASPNPNPVKGVKSSDIMVDPSRNLWFRLFVPTDTDTTTTSLPVVIFFHGGGFTFLSPSSFAYDAVCRRFARKLPAVVISVNYRLSPEHRYPSQYDDGFDVIQYLDRSKLKQLPDFADLSKCFLAGDSAGANLAHNVAVRASREGFQFRVVKIIGLISIQPFFGGEERTDSEIRLRKSPIVSLERTDWLWKVFLPQGSDKDHEAVNVSGPKAVDISGLEYPETVVFVGGFDPLQDRQRSYYEWLKKSGKQARLIEYPNMMHAFYVFPELPESSQLIAQLLNRKWNVKSYMMPQTIRDH
nr:putative carboxylesterase 18 [Quercus suber]